MLVIFCRNFYTIVYNLQDNHNLKYVPSESFPFWAFLDFDCLFEMHWFLLLLHFASTANIEMNS